MKVRALNSKVLVTELERGERTIGRIFIPDDNRKMTGVRDRWALVYSVGKNIDEIQENDWVLVRHGRWTRGVTVKNDDGTDLPLWSIDWPDAILLVADTPAEGTLPDIPDIPTLDLPTLDR